MTDSEEARLQRMDLTKLEESDEFIDHEDDFPEKKRCYQGLLDSTIIDDKDKPKQKPYFEIETNSGEKAYTACHLPIVIVTLRGQGKKKTSLTKIEQLPEEILWANEETKEWCLLHMTYDEIKVKSSHSALKLATEPDF